VITLPDVVSQLMAVSMCLLYELGIHAARWLLPHQAGTGAAASGK
jgi:sec-independent protein translocase protein TatC